MKNIFTLIQDKNIEFGFLQYYLRKAKTSQLFLEEQLSPESLQDLASLPEILENDPIEKRSSIEHGNLSAAIIEDILYKLSLFEKKMDFLQPDLSLTNLAYEFATNTNYLSRVVNQFKGKNFSQYTNTLRINYIIQKLETDKKFRRYTIKAISNEAGFNTAESFGKAFYQVTGMLPSLFIKQLEA